MLGDTDAKTKLCNAHDLLLCPMCGSSGILTNDGLHILDSNVTTADKTTALKYFRTNWKVQCSNCWLSTPSVETRYQWTASGELQPIGFDGKDDVVEMWNSRAQILDKHQLVKLLEEYK